MERLWRGSGQLLDRFCRDCGEVLERKFWTGSGRERSRRGSGEVPERLWEGFGEVPERFWGGSGEVLERFWTGSARFRRA